VSLIPNVAETRPPGQSRIFAYGFDAAGFPAGDPAVPVDGIGWIEFRHFNDRESLENADGVIVPQGIFEKIESHDSMFGPKSFVAVDPSLLERERQVFNLLRAGKWICFLVGDIVDEVSQGIHSEPVRDTDLCKRILNAFAVGRRHRYRIDLGNPPEVKIRNGEFGPYVLAYGNPTTVFELPRFYPIERRVIVELGDQAVGIEFDARLFFLPFCPPDKNGSTALSVVKTVAQAISEYRQNRIVEIPSWVDELRFESEEGLYLEINSLLQKVTRLESQLLSWRDYKSILTTSGKHLRNKVAALLESVFDLRVELDEDPASAIIKDDHQRPALMMEIQSTEGVVEKNSVDQTHQHRQSRSLPESFPAVLFINSNRSIAQIEKRARAGIPEESVRYAKDRSVLIAQTIDLLLLTQQLEKDLHRKRELMRLLLSGGGCLKVDRDGPRIFS
jgi:hypothetical protein